MLKLFSLLETRVKATNMGKLYLNVCPGWCFHSNSSCHNNSRIVIAWLLNVYTVNIIETHSQLIHCYGLIRTCITSSQYSLLINGSPSTPIHPNRGLRQGDPLSPLLFTLCMEYFTRIMKKISVMKGYKYHPLCRRIGLNHLCFADDILIFSKGDIHTIILNLAGLMLFTDSTGLEISAEKSEIFCAGMDSSIINRIQELSGFKLGELPFTYLGVPMSPNNIRPDDCERLVDKMCA